ncbi:MAG TPA: TSUP family transporter, partial [Burkholderiales bacterium]|nr:TSUP family transporter [Burkholderiales bacterium]
MSYIILTQRYFHRIKRAPSIWPMDPWFVVLGLVVGALVGMTGVGAGSLVTPALALSGVPAAVAVGTDLAYAAVSKSFGALV